MRITDLPYQFLGDRFRSNDTVIVAPGQDDCSVLSFPQELLVTTTDFVNSRPALLTLNVGDLGDVGYLSVIANLSDLLGTGAKPIGCLMGVQLAQEHLATDYERIMSGALRCLEEYDVPLLGGDTKKGRELSIYGVGIGTAQSHDELFLSNRATPGDSVLLSGPIGAFNAAVYAISQNNCPLELRNRCVEAIVRPSLAFDLSRCLSNTKLSRAGIDVSDGLGADLQKLATASGVGLRILSAAIPISPIALAVGELYGVNPVKFAFATGGDFQFIATGKSVLGAHEIGVVTEKTEGLLLEHEGKELNLPTTGHDDALMRTFDDEVRNLVGELPL